MRFAASALPLLAMLTAPSACLALAFSVTGNQPQSAANYSRWPGLAKVVNQPSRQLLNWCNGNEHLSYRGDSEALNAMLRDFAVIKASSRRVVLRPGPLGVESKFDWQLHVLEGIARGMAKHAKTESTSDMDPTLTVYVSDRLDLEAIQFPSELKITDLNDLRTRYEAAQRTGNERTKKDAQRLLQALDTDSIRDEIGRQKYDARLRQIHTLVERVRKSGISKSSNR
ncbi:MAG: hypothetical protein CMJ48_00830 [Planctomycetaceae bacterium]|nr:hypothetical protein [Planctomycetaceae bacterium]